MWAHNYSLNELTVGNLAWARKNPRRKSNFSWSNFFDLSKFQCHHITFSTASVFLCRIPPHCILSPRGANFWLCFVTHTQATNGATPVEEEWTLVRRGEDLVDRYGSAVFCESLTRNTHLRSQRVRTTSGLENDRTRAAFGAMLEKKRIFLS